MQSPQRSILLCLTVLCSLAAAAVPTQRLPTSRDGQVVTLLNQGSFSALDIETGPGAGKDPAKVFGQDVRGAKLSQRWRLKLADKSKQYWTLKSQARAQVLEINDGDSSDGAPAQGWTPTTDPDSKFNQYWEIFISYQGWDRVLLSLRNVRSQTWLKLENGDPSNGAKVIGNSWDDTTPNKWQPIVWT